MENLSNSNNTENTPNLIDTALGYLSHWRLFAISIIICLIIGVYIVFTTQKQYSITSSILLNEDKNSKSGGLGSLEGLADLGLMSTTNNVDNEIAVLTSPDLMKQVVDSLHIQTCYSIKKSLRLIEVYKEKCPYVVTLVDPSPEFSENIDLTLNRDNKGFSVNGSLVDPMGKKEAFSAVMPTLPGSLELPNKLGKLSFNLSNEQAGHNSEFFIKIQSSDAIASKLVKSLVIQSTTKTSSVLNMTISCTNQQKGKDILSTLTKKYNEGNVKDNNQTSINTANFINDRLKFITEELKDVEAGVESYKKSRGISDLGAQTKLYTEQTGTTEKELMDAEVQSQVINLVVQSIKDQNNQDKPIPNLGITDPGLVAAITSYNNELLDFQRLSSSVTNENPSRKREAESLKNKRESIINSVDNVKKSMDIAKRDILKQSKETSARILSVPEQERGLLERMRQQEIKEKLYLYLLQKREETNISMASTSDKAKIVTAPRASEIAITAPNSKKILLAALILGLIIAFAIIYIRSMFKVSIGNREELEKLSRVPVIGQIPNNEIGETIVVRKDENFAITELFRSLRNNIGFILNNSDKKVILVTSTVSGEGKTFISINTAISFALNKKKVLLIGLDIRNPQLANGFNIKQKTGVTSYLSSDVSNWRDLVCPFSENPDLHIIHGGIVPPNPNELLMSSALDRLIEEARNEYDIVILDTAPVGIISDTFLLNKFADMILYVVRENITHKESITFINTQTEEGRLENVYMVLNDVHKSNESYRYGYGHTYGYNNGYKKNKK